MTWRMPAETAPHDRTWMAFPREGEVMGDSSAAREATYAAWAAVAHAILPFEPVTMVVDPSERSRARAMLSAEVDIVEAPLDDFWMRDIGPTFVVDDETGQLRVEKSLTTPKDLTQGVEDTIRLAQVEPEKIDFFVHGGTTVINAITERKGAKTALVTTAGFRDVLEIAMAAVSPPTVSASG